MAQQRKKRTVSDNQKAAMQEGRVQGRAVAAYLDALQAYKPKRGRKRTPESIAKRLADIDRQLASASPVKQLSLIQERLNLLSEQDSMTTAPDISGLEEEFVQTAKTYGERKGITYAAWRELNVSPSVLKRAGITRSSS